MLLMPLVPHTNHMTDHPITPPPELVRQWQREANHNEPMFPQIANQAAQWGADQELDACSAQIYQCCLLTNEQCVAIAEYLHYCRRPTKLPRLKE